jgi:nucleolar complex protein 3
LHDLSKPPRVRSKTDDLPSLDSHDEDGDSGVDSVSLITEVDSGDDSDDPSSSFDLEVNSDIEQPYERIPRMGPAESETVPRLPIKLPDGRVVETARRVLPQAESESEDEAGPSSPRPYAVEDVSTGARFGRPAVASVIGTSSRQARIQMAKEQMAGICQEILADPESSVSIVVYS